MEERFHTGPGAPGPLLAPKLLVPVLAAVMMVYLAAMWAYASYYGGDVSSLVCIGDRNAAPKLYQGRYQIMENSYGYDGQFYLMIALDPFITGQAFENMDKPAYRYQRVLYPWVSRLLSFGQPELIPVAMAAVNLAAVLFGTLVIGVFCLRQGLTPGWALVYGLSSGLFLSSLRDLAEPGPPGMIAATASFAGPAAGHIARSCC